jgi:hypothetical protein
VKKLLLLMFAFGSIGASAQTSYELGQKLSDDTLQYIPKQHCLTGPATVEPCMRVRTHGVVYTIGYRAKGKVVVYVETHDPGFSTASGLRIGSSLSGAAGSLLWMNDFGEVVGPDTSDGWQPVVAYDRALHCENGASTELSIQETHNTEACPLRVLSFKKRAAFRLAAKDQSGFLGYASQ